MNPGVFCAAFSSASVEFFETAAIAYAIGRAGYRREAIFGSIIGTVGVAAAAAIFGVGLSRIPLASLRLMVGLVLFVAGLNWTLKSLTRRAKGSRAKWIADPLHDAQVEPTPKKFSVFNFVVMTKSSALEALEVAVIAVLLGTGSGAWRSAIFGSVLALFTTIAVVAALHGFLMKIPEIAIKLAAGVLLLSYGTFWIGEGAGIKWPGDALSLLAIIFIYAAAATTAMFMLTPRSLPHATS